MKKTIEKILQDKGQRVNVIGVAKVLGIHFSSWELEERVEL